MVMNNKKAIAMSFNWIFAIIVGAVILFLAIYSATRFIQTSETVISTETSAKLISLLDPLETGLASGKSEQINFKKLTRTYYECSSLDNRPFGKQTIAFSEQTFGDEFGETGGKVPVYNKYVFAENMVEGKDLYLFSKPFFMPFKIGDLIIISSQDYCFYQAPNNIKDDLEGLNLKNIKFTDVKEECGADDSVVCFGSNQCDINVLNEKVIKNNGDELYYVGDLVYAAIFSSSEIYECNLKRLKNRFNELALVYIDKIKIFEQKECSSNIEIDLTIMRGFELESSMGISSLVDYSEDVNLLNQATRGGCKLY